VDLYGEYYDFGRKRAVMILSGRTESLRYGYYFAIPYAAAGWNILVVDPRAHGKSGGEFNTVGFEESRDDIAWVKHLRDAHGVEQVVFHGICIGAAGGMLALTSEDCPDTVCGMVTEGMFPNFGESMKNHLIERKKPVKTFYPLINAWMKHYTGHSMNKGPIDVIHKMDIPLLMLHSREDRYSTPEYAQRLFDLAGTSDKRLVWFPVGRHSMLRITDTERYDTAVKEFVKQFDTALIS
jgi:alpha-beta hydrolase superfamily lysophospholipase